MTRAAVFALPVLLAAALAGCSEETPGPPVPADPWVQDQLPDPGENNLMPTSPAPTTKAEGILPMGTARTFEGDGVKGSVQVVAYKGGQYANYQVRLCNLKNESGSPFTIYTTPMWSIVYGTDEYADDLSYSGPKPEYPDGKDLREGQCARGWISFELVGGKQPQGIDYDGGAGHYQWRNTR